MGNNTEFTVAHCVNCRERCVSATHRLEVFYIDGQTEYGKGRRCSLIIESSPFKTMKIDGVFKEKRFIVRKDATTHWLNRDLSSCKDNDLISRNE